MYNNKKFLAIIPARSGSKGLPDKNIKELNGKPMIGYTIEAAMKSEVFDDIIVSTDSNKYADIVRSYNINVPFLRPHHLSTDESSTMDVIEYTINKLDELGKEYDYFMLLQPTSPLRDYSDILNSINILFDKGANSVVSVCEVDHSPILNCTIDESLSLDNFLSNIESSRRQDLPDYYRLNGAIYLVKVDYFLKYKNFYKENSYAYIMDKHKSIDIDDIYQFKLAEIILKENTVNK